MIRRSFRFGLWVGLLCGIAVAVAKIVQSRRSAPVPAAEPWTPLDREPATTPATSPAAPAGVEETAAAEAAAEPEPEPHPELVLAPAPDDVATEEPPPPPAPEDIPPAVYAAKRVAKQAAKATQATEKATEVVEAMEASSSPAPAKKAAKKSKARLWVEPVGEVCPDSHPVKAKLASKILHSPGSPSYDRTVPDRCYRSAEAAEADGFRSAKR